MTTNPYESPEYESNVPKQPTDMWSPALRIMALLGLLGLLFICVMPRGFFPGGAREASRRMLCSNHLKQIGLALQNYHDEYHSLPPAYVADSSGKPIHSWRVLILPYLEQKALYDKYSFDEPWDGPNNSKLHKEIVHVLCCPSRSADQPETETSYVAVVGAKTAWPNDKSISFADITDGTSNTVIIVETTNSGIHWMEPRDLRFDQIPMAVNPKNDQGISSEHPNVAMAVFLDGHTYALTTKTSPETVQRLLMIADGEQIGDY